LLSSNISDKTDLVETRSLHSLRVDFLEIRPSFNWLDARPACLV